MDDLKGKMVGVISADTNRQVIAAITREYALESAKVSFKNLAPNEVPQAFQTKQIQALLVVLPLSERYIAMLREIFPRTAKASLGLVPIESAGAIEEVSPPFKSYELPKGTLRGSPPVPDDDLTTLRVPYFLVANKNLSDDTVTSLTKAMMEARRDLVGEFPLLAQVMAPSTDKDAYVPIHPGAAAFFDGDEKTIFDKYGDQFFYGSMLLGTLMSVLAAIWKFMPQDAGLRYAVGLALVRQKKQDDALAELKRAVELAPDQAHYSYVYAVGLHSAGRIDEAIAALKDNLTKHPMDRESLLALVSFYRDSGNIASALEYAQRLAQIAPNDRRITDLVDSLKRQAESAPR